MKKWTVFDWKSRWGWWEESEMVWACLIILHKKTYLPISPSCERHVISKRLAELLREANSFDSANPLCKTSRKIKKTKSWNLNFLITLKHIMMKVARSVITWLASSSMIPFCGWMTMTDCERYWREIFWLIDTRVKRDFRLIYFWLYLHAAFVHRFRKYVIFYMELEFTILIEISCIPCNNKRPEEIKVFLTLGRGVNLFICSLYLML